MKKTSRLLKLNFAFLLIGMFILTTGCSNAERLSTEEKLAAETLVLTVDDSEVYLDEMMYHVMLARMQGDLYASVVGTDKDYWDIVNEDGIPMGEATKEMAMENAIKYELLYNLAIKEGYTLSEEDKLLSQSKVDNIMNNLKAEQLQQFNLTKEKLVTIQNKIAIATNYYDNFLEDIGVDEEAIKSQVDIKDYKQYDIQYMFAQKEEYKELETLVEVASTTEDFITLTSNSKIKSGLLSFLEGANTFGEESILEDTIKTMEAGEVSKIVETTKGHYIIKLLDNESTQKYDFAVTEAVNDATMKAFDTAYVSLKKDHNIIINKKVWEKIEIENIIIG